MITTVRKLTADDNVATVARLIYETNNCLFPVFFNDNKPLAKEVLSRMIEGDTIYNKNNIIVACIDSEIIGIIVINKTPIKIDISAYTDAFEMSGALIDDTFERVLKEYYLPLESSPDGYFISCLCVDERFRSQGVGSAMLDVLTSHLDPSLDVYIDCAASNARAISVYEAHGFEKLFDFDGFDSTPYCKMIKRAKSQN